MEEFKTIDNLFDTITDFNELYEAYVCARKTRRYKSEVLKFNNKLEYALLGLQEELRNETYVMSKYRRFYVREPKVRMIMSLPFRDRVVQWSIYRHLMPVYDKLFIEDSYACRKNKGSHRAINRLQYWLKWIHDCKYDETWYYLKLDISKYFYTIDHDVLIHILSKRIKDKRLFRLLKQIINSDEMCFGLPEGVSPDPLDYNIWIPDKGIPIGNLTSQLFANIYLNECDQYCKHKLKIHHYIRYMDDIIILGNDKEQLGNMKMEIEYLLNNKFMLTLNRKCCIDKVSSGITFLGYRIWHNFKKLKNQSARRIMRYTKHLCIELDNKEITMDQFKRVMASYNGILMNCNADGLRNKLNEIYQEYAVKDLNPLFEIKNGPVDIDYKI